MLMLEGDRHGLVLEWKDTSIIIHDPSRPARIVMSIPHDGLITNDLEGFCKSRSSGFRGRDKHVWPVAKDVLCGAYDCGLRMSAVRFLIPRAFVDANREEPSAVNIDPDTRGQTAFDDLRLTGVYRHYHGEIERLVKAAVQMHGKDKVLLLDMHGFRKQPTFAPPQGYDLILGTANRATIHYGEVDREFASFMEERKYRVFLPSDKPITLQGDPYSAGHITRLYARTFRINAMQIEISPTFRSKDAQEKGEKLAKDIADFLAVHYR